MYLNPVIKNELSNCARKIYFGDSRHKNFQYTSYSGSAVVGLLTVMATRFVANILTKSGISY